jgi:hypothetical protein
LSHLTEVGEVQTSFVSRTDMMAETLVAPLIMLVTQRPSELPDTALSQCGTLISLRLANSAGQARIRAALPYSNHVAWEVPVSPLPRE